MALTLTKKQRNELVTAHRREKELRYGDRIKSIVYLADGMSYEEAAELLLCSDKSIRITSAQNFAAGFLQIQSHP